MNLSVTVIIEGWKNTVSVARDKEQAATPEEVIQLAEEAAKQAVAGWRG